MYNVSHIHFDVSWVCFGGRWYPGLFLWISFNGRWLRHRSSSACTWFQEGSLWCPLLGAMETILNIWLVQLSEVFLQNAWTASFEMVFVLPLSSGWHFRRLNFFLGISSLFWPLVSNDCPDYLSLRWMWLQEGLRPRFYTMSNLALVSLTAVFLEPYWSHSSNVDDV